MSESLPYDGRNPDRSISVEHGKMQYGTAAESGHVEIQIPAPAGSPRETETLHVRNFGQHIISKIESAASRQGYMRSGPLQSPAQTFRHYASVARGAQLLDAEGLKRMETLAAEYERESEPEEFYRTVVKPWLGGLSPRKR